MKLAKWSQKVNSLLKEPPKKTSDGELVTQWVNENQHAVALSDQDKICRFIHEALMLRLRRDGVTKISVAWDEMSMVYEIQASFNVRTKEGRKEAKIATCELYSERINTYSEFSQLWQEFMTHVGVLLLETAGMLPDGTAVRSRSRLDKIGLKLTQEAERAAEQAAIDSIMRSSAQ